MGVAPDAETTPGTVLASSWGAVTVAGERDGGD